MLPQEIKGNHSFFNCQKTRWKGKEYSKTSFKKVVGNHALKKFVFHVALPAALDILGIFEK